MAEKKTIIIDVQTEDGVKSMNLLETSFEDVYGEVAPLNTRLGELEDQLYQLANAGKANSDEFKVISQEVGRMKRVVADVDLQVDALAMTTANKLGGALTGVTSGFEFAQGAMGAMGVESEEVEGALLKVQSAMAMAQGIQGLKESVPAFKAMGNSAKTALGGVKGAVLATGIGIFLVAIGLVAANWDKVTEAAGKFASGAGKMIGDFSNKFPKVAKVIKVALQMAFAPLLLAIEAGKKLYDVFTGTTAATRKVSAEQAKVHSARMAQLDEERNAQKKVMAGLDQKIALLNAEGKSTIALREEKLKLQRVDAEGTLQALKATQAMAGKNSLLGKTYNELIDNAQNMVDEIAVSEVMLTKEKKDEENQRIADAKTAAEQRKAIAQKEYDDKMAMLQKQRDDDEANAVTATLDRDKVHVDAIDSLWLRTQEEARINKEARDKKLEADKIAKAEEERLDEEAFQKKKQRAEMGVDMTVNALSAVADIAEAFAGDDLKRQKKAFQIRKAANIASAVMDTYKGAASAFAETPGGIVIKSIAAGIAVAAGFARVAAIAKTKFDGGSVSASGGGGGGGGGGSAASISSPANFNIVGNSGTNQLLEGLQNAPVQAYVVSGEVTTAQGLDRNRVKTATL